MTDQYREFFEFLKAMEQKRVDYVLVGGFAIVLHGMHRHTMDIDVFVRNQQENIKKLRAALNSLYDDPDIAEITCQELKEYPVIRYGSPSGTIIDIMTKQGTAISYDDIEFESYIIQGQSIRIATPETLLKMKEDTIRPIDQQDAQFCRHLIVNRTKPDEK